VATKCPRCQAENTESSKFCADCGSRLFPPADVPFTKTMTLETGYKVLGKGKIFAGKYAIVGEIGRGGMGVVYKAEDTKLKRTVALKFLPPELSIYPEAKERFIREAQSAAALSHPNICTIHEVEEADGQPYIAMEFVEGQSLHQKVVRGPMDSDAVVDIAVQVAEGLEAAHQRGIIHRDIKSANIMVTERGQAKIMDFGLAKVAGESQLTKEARTVGTIAYMSPEQAQGEDPDKRTDIWSLGVVLYEMLTGQLPFRSDRESVILHAIVEAEPKPLRQLKSDIPAGLQKIVDRAMKKRRADRYASATEIAADLRKYLDTRRAEEAGFFNLKSLAKRMKRPAYFIPAAAVLIAIGFFAYRHIDRNAHVRWARQVALPEIQRLYQDSQFSEALKVASRAECYIPKDPAFREILSQIAGELSVESDPLGATVYIREYNAKEAPWQSLGQTPLARVRVAKGHWRLKLEKQGFEPVEIWYYISEKALDKTYWGSQTYNDIISGGPSLRLRLAPKGSLPAGMVRIQGTGEKSFQPDDSHLSTATPLALTDYLLDKFEVTNRQYKAFMDGGGYREQKFWKHPFVRNGRPVSWEEAMKLLTDKTGTPGPSGWELGDYPQGQDDYPVSGVSWYEAAAYAEFAGKVLPSVYHWKWAIRSGQDTSEAILPLSNFGGRGPSLVGISQALSLAGTYDQCGNVKEWCWNAVGNRGTVLGGAWDQPSYLGFGTEFYPPFSRDSRLGFRCMQYLGQPESAAKAFDPIPVPAEKDFSKYTPCSDDAFEVIKGIYSYQKTDLEPAVEFRRDYSEYASLEKVSYWDANRRLRLFAYIFLPKKFQPPFQTVVYYPGGHAFHLRSLFEYPLLEADFYLKNGRAFVFPVFHGSFERTDEVPNKHPYTAQQERDLWVGDFKDLARSIDYVETRPSDFKADKIAYHGLSAGAVFSPVPGALETRIKAIVAIGGGANTVRDTPSPYSAEIDMINFLPRVKVPFFLANGNYDYYFPLETNLKVFMKLLGTPEKDKYLKLYDMGHIAISPKSFKDILDFLDKYLGRVN
jgi:eukaryotic-like serine/threonine-protein kinase